MLWLIGVIVIGGIAGWLAGQLTRGGGFGILANVGLGILGSFVGSAALWLVGLRAFGLIGNLIAATLGAVIILVVAAQLQKR